MARARKNTGYDLNSSFVDASKNLYSIDTAKNLRFWCRMNPGTPVDLGPNSLSPAYDSSPTVSSVILGNKTYYALVSNDTAGQAARVSATSGLLSFSSAASGGLPSAGTDRPFSVSLWVKLDNLAAIQLLFAKDAGAGPYTNYEYKVNVNNTGRVEFYLKDINASAEQRVFYSSISAGLWYHLTFTYDGRGGTNAYLGVKIYVNGAEVSTTASTTGTYVGMNPNYDFPLLIAQDADEADELDGQVSEFAVWGVALSSSEVLAVYNSTRNGSYPVSSGFISNPARVLLQERDCATGSYPTIARTGDPDFTGAYRSFYDDTNTINFVGNSQTVYPTALPAISKWVSGGIATPNILQGLIAAGTSSKGVADAQVSFTPGQNISPFNESRTYIDNNLSFYQTGTDQSILPGFDQRLSSKSIITIDITPKKSTDVHFSTGTTPGPSVGGIDQGVNSGLAYFNFENKTWEIVGNLITGSNVDYFNSDINVAKNSMLAVTNNNWWAATLGQNYGLAVRSFGSPCDFAGFPNATKFNSTGSQQLSLSSSISGPFLLEKFRLEVSATIRQTPYIKNGYDSAVQSTFVLMLERQNDAPRTFTVPVTLSDASVSSTVASGSVSILDGTAIVAAAAGTNMIVNIISTDGTNKNYRFRAGVTGATFSGDVVVNTGVGTSLTALAAELAIAIADVTNGHAGKILTSQNVGVLTLTQAAGGAAGNQSITLTNVTGNAIAKVDFSGGSAVPYTTNIQYSSTKDRRILGYVRVGRFTSASATPSFNFSSLREFESLHPNIYASCETWLPTTARIPSESDDIPTTGKIIFEDFAKIPSRTPNVSPYVWTRGTDGFNGKYKFLGKSVGSRNMFDVSDGRSFIRGVAGGQISGSVTSVNTLYGNVNFTQTVYENDFEVSPFVLLPDDKLILAYAHQVAPGVGGENEIQLVPLKNTLEAGDSKLTLFGSLLRGNLPVSPETNQPLTSDAIHEDLHYNNPVFDQFDVEPYSSLSGSYVDLIITGSMLALPIGDPTAKGVRKVQGSVAAGQAGSTGSLQRFVNLISESDLHYDSIIPNPVQLYKLAGGTDPTTILFVGDALVFENPSSAAGVRTARNYSRSFPFEGKYNEASRITSIQSLQSLSGSLANSFTGLTAYGSSDINDFKFYSDLDPDGTTLLPITIEQVIQVFFGAGPYVGFPDIELSSGSPKAGKPSRSSIRGFRYGLMNYVKNNSSAKFRRDRYGQFRDMLEQTSNAAYLVANSVEYPLEIQFLSRPGKDGKGRQQTSAIQTHAQNLSNYATSSLPYFDGVARERNDNPDETVSDVSIGI